MSTICFLRATLVASFLALAAAAPCAAQIGETPSRVTIRLYDSAYMPESQRAVALTTAATIVAQTGVAAAWLDCTGGSERPLCTQPRAARDLIIRIAPTFLPGPAVARGSIESRTDRNAAGIVLGLAVVEPSTGIGALATVFVDRVQAIAQRTAVPAGLLLGRVIAHEVGHLLLGTNAHSRSGLMREVWTDAELTFDRAEDWLFTAAERAALEPYGTAPSEHTSDTGIHQHLRAIHPDR